MLEEIKKILKEEYGLTDVSEQTDIRKDLGLNSFELMNLLCILEERYGIELDEEKYRDLSTVGEMCRCLEEITKKR